MCKKLIVAASFYLFMMTAFAENNPLSVHVLNTQDGLPGPEIEVTLEYYSSGNWVHLNNKITNEKGRITDLYPSNMKLKEGIYKVTFKTGEWMKRKNIATFFPEIPVVFSVDGKLEHYHIPLLLSPFGYSTYRGN